MGKANMTKPVVGFIGGRTAPPGKRMGHAGAIIRRKRNSRRKNARNEECGIKVAETPSVMGETMIECIKRKRLIR